MEKITNQKGSKLDLKRNKAITLIALIVTIIVIAVLAGVSVSMLVGENRNL